MALSAELAGPAGYGRAEGPTTRPGRADRQRPERPGGAGPQFIWHQFDHGLIGAVPVGWLIVSAGPDTTCFYDPLSARVLGVRVFPSIETSPTSALYQAEKALTSTGSAPGYRRISIAAEPLSPGVSDWQYDFTAPRETAPTEVQVRAVFGNTQVGYMISWMTPETDWSTEQDNYSAIWPSYQFVSPNPSAAAPPR